jgi:HEAT repeat protein
VTVRRLVHALLVFSALPAAARGQNLAQRIAAVERGTVRLSFTARPGVCGDGLHNIRVVDRVDEWEEDCEPQPVRVALEVHDRRVTEGPVVRWRPLAPGSIGHRPGYRSPQAAAAYFISLAEQDGNVSGDPLLPATLADSVTSWPALLRLARTLAVPLETRRMAVFWLGQAAGAAAARSLDSIAGDSAGDREVRKQAVFALSQRSGNEGVPALLRIARTNPDPELRKTALFWLGQSEDPRALALFEEILR